jgi:hypothetical protein
LVTDGRDAEKPDQVGGDDTVEVADADDPAWELTAAGQASIARQALPSGVPGPL